MLKKTFADLGEILRFEWIDLKDNILSISHPVKGHLPGKYQISLRLVAMITRFAKKRQTRLSHDICNCRRSSKEPRKRAATKFQNLNPLTISFKSYRH